MNLLVLGTVLSPEAFSYNLAANPASTKWLSGFIGGLQANACELSLCGHCYAQVWPKGPLFPGDSNYLWKGCPNHLVKFLNAPSLRFGSMARGYFKKADALFGASNFDAVITYNPYPWHARAARRLRSKYGIPWICLNLDFDNVGEGWSHFLRDAGDADGHLFLSHWGYENAPVAQKIHLDSGVPSIPDGFDQHLESDTINIVYLGKLSKSGGLEILLKLPELIDHAKVRFVYGGKGYPDADRRLRELAKRDERVDYRGFVDESEVKSIFQNATVFLNPRDPEDVVNDMVFPSKVMQYLQHGRTVVSTWTRGLEPIYRGMMLIAETPSALDFALAVKSAISESHTVREQRGQRIKSFIEGSRLWTKQAQRFVDFTEAIIRDCPRKAED